ncbi:hypothetical protein GCM10028790_54690 [Micromonospora taraxaci]
MPGVMDPCRNPAVLLKTRTVNGAALAVGGAATMPPATRIVLSARPSHDLRDLRTVGSFRGAGTACADHARRWWDEICECIVASR